MCRALVGANQGAAALKGMSEREGAGSLICVVMDSQGGGLVDCACADCSGNRDALGWKQGICFCRLRSTHSSATAESSPGPCIAQDLV